MLDTHSHRERLLHNIESLREYHLICITCRVPDSENKCITFDTLNSIDHDSNELAVDYLHICHTGTEPDIRSK